MNAVNDDLGMMMIMEPGTGLACNTSVAINAKQNNCMCVTSLEEPRRDEPDSVGLLVQIRSKVIHILRVGARYFRS